MKQGGARDVGAEVAPAPGPAAATAVQRPGTRTASAGLQAADAPPAPVKAGAPGAVTVPEKADQQAPATAEIACPCPVPEQARAIRAVVERMAADRAPRSLCPSEVARAMAEDWRPMMPAIRAVAAAMQAEGALSVTQRGRPTEPLRAKGPIRLALPPIRTEDDRG